MVGVDVRRGPTKDTGRTTHLKLFLGSEELLVAHLEVEDLVLERKDLVRLFKARRLARLLDLIVLDLQLNHVLAQLQALFLAASRRG